MPTSAYWGGGDICQIQVGASGTRASLGSKFFHFHAVFGKKNWKITPIWELAPPPQDNPGSATGRGGLPTKGCAYFYLRGGSLSRGVGGGSMPGWRTPDCHCSSQYASYWNAFLLIIRWTRRMDNTETIKLSVFTIFPIFTVLTNSTKF